MGILENTMEKEGYGGDMLNALKILSSDQSKKILQAVAMSKPPEASPMSPPVQASLPQANPQDVMSMANQMVQPQASGASAQVQQPQGVVQPQPQAQMPQGNGDTTALIKKYFPPDQWLNAYKIMMAESGGRADAVGDNYPIRGQTIPSYGLFQIRALPGRPAPQLLQDPEFNVKYAAEMQAKQGWGPWSTSKKLGIK